MWRQDIMKRFFIFFICFWGFQAQAAEHLTIAAAGAHHAEILEFIRPILAQDGIELRVKKIYDSTHLNNLVQTKRLDVNFFQHRLFLENFNEVNKTTLVEVAGVHLELMGAYSQKVKAFTDLPDGATVIIPKDPANRGRALLLLERAGLIELEDSSNLLSTQRSIRRNPYGLKIHELDNTVIPRLLDRVDLAVTTTGLLAAETDKKFKDALLMEEKTPLYVDILVTHQDNRNKPAIRKLARALQTDDVKNFIHEKYHGMVISAF